MTSNVMIDKICPICGKLHTVLIPYIGYMRWQAGYKIQEAMPEVSTTDREILISGLCVTCQNEISDVTIEETTSLSEDEILSFDDDFSDLFRWLIEENKNELSIDLCPIF